VLQAIPRIKKLHIDRIKYMNVNIENIIYKKFPAAKQRGSLYYFNSILRSVEAEFLKPFVTDLDGFEGFHTVEGLVLLYNIVLHP